MAYYLAADGGTESLRVRLFDLAGHCLASVAAPYETKFYPGARAEQDQGVGQQLKIPGEAPRIPRPTQMAYAPMLCRLAIRCRGSHRSSA